MRHGCLSRKWLRRECPDVLVNVQKRLRNRGAAREWVDVDCVEQSWVHTRNTEKSGASRRAPRIRPCALWTVLELADPGVTTKPRGRTEATSRPADNSPSLLAQDARPWICVQRLPMLHQRGDAAPAVLIAQRRMINGKIQDLRVQGTVQRPLVWTADGRPHQLSPERRNMPLISGPAGTGTLEHTWKHDVPIALQARRAAMTRAALPNTSARVQWLLVGSPGHGVTRR